MEQAATGIASFDVPDMLKPMSDCVHSMQQQMNRSKISLIAEMHRDPVRQFSPEEVQSATQFLDKARDAMQSIIDGFKAESLKNADDDNIKMMQEKSRESARKLVLLFGDSSRKFQGDSMKGQMVSIQESSQATEVRARLTSLKSFFDTFATAEWLGQLFAMKDFQKELKMVLAILDGLLNPKPVLLDTREVASLTDTLRKVDQDLAQVGSRLVELQQISARNPHRNYNYWHTMEFPKSPPASLTESENEEWAKLLLQMEDLRSVRAQWKKSCKDSEQYTQHASKGQQYGYSCWEGGEEEYQYGEEEYQYGEEEYQCGYSCSVKKQVVPNPLSSFFAPVNTMSCKPVMEQLQSLTDMCAALKSILEEDERKRDDMRSAYQSKMTSLAQFAEALNGIAGVVKRYVLSRLADIGKDDISVLKSWVTHEEATEVHKTLEAFRDEAIQERAFRSAAAMMREHASGQSWQLMPGSESSDDISSSVKRYLFENSVGCAHGAHIEEVEETCSDNEDQNGVSPGKKLSKHQRERRAKFRSSIPRTPSSGTYQG